MSVICNSHERTSVEYIKLCNITDFEYKGATQLNDLQTILMFIKK